MIVEENPDQNIDLNSFPFLPKEQTSINSEWNHTINSENISINNKDCMYLEAMNSLQQYSLPSIIPCREKEKDIIMEFLVDGFAGKGCASTLYISGFPGVGKTIVTNDTIDRFKQRNINKKRAPDFLDIRINAMNLVKPHAIYISILKQMTGLDIPAYKALATLNDILSKGVFPRSLYKNVSEANAKQIQRKIQRTKIMFIDQVDYLFTKDQDVLYNIFQWTHQHQSKIVLITASNTFTFPEELEQKILSRIGSQRLNFMAYTSAQIEQILSKRLIDLNIFENEGIRFISKRLSTTSDIRKCLFILRQCINKHLDLKQSSENSEDLINVDTINQTLKEIYDNALINSLKYLPDTLKRVLINIFQVIKETGIYCWLSQLYIHMKMSEERAWSTADIEESLARLQQLNILKISIREKHKRKSMTSKDIPTHLSEFKIELNVETTALLKAFDLL